MALPYLFYINGLLEGPTAYNFWNKPEVYCAEPAKLSADGRMYARRGALLLGGFSIASILMAKQPDSPAKQ
eukprot:CAMPEP_0201585202 /NCGR_PEP_ID=MMETSP0190_2-20130828/119321_1 /ASSEMBLY_ACC=CAM_ASM_000263 /TAXON_ID=37353 /ORGANISM="Rosalina sp." /LENGTH=70 /DNA_ID=CAMNT_0048030683 /DNA_START=1 /DNA_END=210 /DNA_ORIENTATION=+